jgi:hypothetical protein
MSFLKGPLRRIPANGSPFCSSALVPWAGIPGLGSRDQTWQPAATWSARLPHAFAFDADPGRGRRRGAYRLARILGPSDRPWRHGRCIRQTARNSAATRPGHRMPVFVSLIR